MVLLVNGQRVTADALTSHPALLAAGERFLAQPQDGSAAALPPGKLVYALQGEVATVPADEPAAVLCSSDATTCLIAVVVGSAAAGPAAAAADAVPAHVPPPIARVVHHDEGTTRSLAALQQTVAGLPVAGPPARLWLAGAYADERGTGAAVAAALLHFLDGCEAALEVQLCCVGQLNTTADGSPRATALAVDLRSGQASPLAPAPEQRGPLVPARMAQWAYQLDSGLRGGDGNSPLRSIYSPATRQLRLTLVQGGPPTQCLWLASALLDLPDQELLQRWSTSPAHEPPHFAAGARWRCWCGTCTRCWVEGLLHLHANLRCSLYHPPFADVRASFEWLLRQSGPVLPLTWTFTWCQDQGWRPAAEAAATAASTASGNMQSRLLPV